MKNKIILVIAVILSALAGYLFSPKENKLGFQTSFYPPSVDFQRAVDSSLDRLIPNKILEYFWDNVFYYIESFVSTESFSSSLVGAGSGFGFTATPQPVFEVFTGTSTGNSALLGKHLFQQDILSFDKKQKFRTHFQVSSTTLIRANLSVGPDGYGFRVSSSSLFGYVTDNDSNESTVNLGMSLSLDVTYFVEAEFSPNDKVIFSVKNATSNIMESRGVLTDLPSGEHTNLCSLELFTNNNARKTMYVQLLELIQDR